MSSRFCAWNAIYNVDNSLSCGIAIYRIGAVGLHFKPILCMECNVQDRYSIVMQNGNLQDRCSGAALQADSVHGMQSTR